MKYVLLLIALVSVSASGQMVGCNEKTIDRIQFQASRDDNHSHANHLVIRFSDATCNGRNYVHLSVDHPMFASVSSMALAAKLSGKKVDVIVNSSKLNGSSTEISILGIVE